MMLHVEGLKGQ